METDRQTGEQTRRERQPRRAASSRQGATARAPTEKIERIDLATLKDMSVGALTKIAKQLDVPARPACASRS